MSVLHQTSIVTYWSTSVATIVFILYVWYWTVGWSVLFFGIVFILLLHMSCCNQEWYEAVRKWHTLLAEMLFGNPVWNFFFLADTLSFFIFLGLSVIYIPPSLNFQYMNIVSTVSHVSKTNFLVEIESFIYAKCFCPMKITHLCFCIISMIGYSCEVVVL